MKTQIMTCVSLDVPISSFYIWKHIYFSEF